MQSVSVCRFVSIMTRAVENRTRWAIHGSQYRVGRLELLWAVLESSSFSNRGLIASVSSSKPALLVADPILVCV